MGMVHHGNGTSWDKWHYKGADSDPSNGRFERSKLTAGAQCKLPACLILKGKLDLVDGPEILESPPKQASVTKSFIKHGLEQKDSSQMPWA